MWICGLMGLNVVRKPRDRSLIRNKRPCNVDLSEVNFTIASVCPPTQINKTLLRRSSCQIQDILFKEVSRQQLYKVIPLINTKMRKERKILSPPLEEMIRKRTQYSICTAQALSQKFLIPDYQYVQQKFQITLYILFKNPRQNVVSDK